MMLVRGADYAAVNLSLVLAGWVEVFQESPARTDEKFLSLASWEAAGIHELQSRYFEQFLKLY